MGHISNINVPKNKVKTLNSCSLFSKSCCVSCYRKMYTVHTEPITLSIKYSNMLFYWLSLPPSLPSHSHPHTHTLPEGFSPQWLSQPSCGLWEQPAQAGSGVCLFLRVCVCVSHQLVHCGRFTPPHPLSYCRSGCSVCIVSKTWHMRDADRNLNQAGTAVKKVWNQSLAEELTKRVELPTSWISDWSKRTH